MLTGCGAVVHPGGNSEPEQTTPSSPHTVHSLDWALHGALVSLDGAYEEAANCRLSGEIHDYETEDDRSYCILQTAADHPYSAGNGVDAMYTTQFEDFPYFVFMGYGYGADENAPTFCYYAVDLQQQYVIAYWRGADHYLVGSVEETVDPAAVYAHFSKFVDYVNSLEEIHR